MLGLQPGDALDHGCERFVPAHRLELAVLAQQRRARAARVVEHVVLAQALGAELAAVHGMIRITAHRDRLALLDADQHAAADGAVAAGRLDPGVGHSRGGDFAIHRVLRVGILCLRGVDAGEPLDLCQQAHAWAPAGRDRTKVSAMLSGTTVTKKR